MVQRTMRRDSRRFAAGATGAPTAWQAACAPQPHRLQSGAQAMGESQRAKRVPGDADRSEGAAGGAPLLARRNAARGAQPGGSATRASCLARATPIPRAST